MRAVIVGSAGFDGAAAPLDIDTPHGPAQLHRCEGGLVLFRHGRPHRLLPNQMNFRANAWALHHAGVSALLVTSSVGVMDLSVPLFELLRVNDIAMLGNRLPDGSSCSMWPVPAEGQGYLLSNQLLHPELGDWLGIERAVDFLYVPGPRTKTPAENRVCAALGIPVNSMTLAPEVVLAAELGIPVTAAVVGHKYSVPGGPDADIASSLNNSRDAMRALILRFLRGAPTPEPSDALYRFA